MVATLPMNRLGFDSPPAELPELPQSVRDGRANPPDPATDPQVVATA